MWIFTDRELPLSGIARPRESSTVCLHYVRRIVDGLRGLQRSVRTVSRGGSYHPRHELWQNAQLVCLRRMSCTLSPWHTLAINSMTLPVASSPIPSRSTLGSRTHTVCNTSLQASRYIGLLLPRSARYTNRTHASDRSIMPGQ